MAEKKNLSVSAQEIESYYERLKLAKAPAWIPTPGTTIMGAEVVGREIRTSDWGPYPAITYKLPTGECVVIHAFHTILRNKLAELGTNMGDRQNITYIGKVTRTEDEMKAGKNEYHDYYAENTGEVRELNDADFAF